MTNDLKYNSYVTAGILTKNDFGIEEVNNLESIKSLRFSFADYSKVEEYIKSGNFQLIEDSVETSQFREYLEIMQFTDQDNKRYVVSVYDSDELWQDPDVIRIYPTH